MTLNENGLGCQISVICPAFNEEENLEPLTLEIEQALLPTGKPFEVIIVDDGSTDSSREVLRRLSREKPFVRGLFLSRNCGQSAATVAGFRSARGRTVFTIDSDLQNNPSDIPKMLELMEQTGCDAVCGIRGARQDTFVRRMSSKIANKVRDMFLHDGLADTGCALKGFKREYVTDLPCFNGLHRFLGAMLRAEGARIEQMVVDHRPRERGVSKYGLHNRLWRGIRDLFGLRWLCARWVKFEIDEATDCRTDQEPGK